VTPADLHFQGESVLGVCGFSGAGKTTLLVHAVTELVRRGLRVGVVKHDAHGITTVDPEHKDSARLFGAGADVVLQGPGEGLRRCRGDGNLAAAVGGLLTDHDVVLVEGHKGTSIAKVWLVDADGREPGPEVEGVVEVLPRDEHRADRFMAFLEDWLARQWSSRPIMGGVLLGGGSRRMGAPKQLVAHRGRTLIEIAVAAVACVADEVVLLGAGEVPENLERLQRLPDIAETDGPMAGLLSAMRWHPRATWIFAACDMPLLRPAAVRWLAEQRRPGTWAVLPRVDDTGIEPLLAVYEHQSRKLLEEIVRNGRRAPRHIHEHPAVRTPTPPEDLRILWANANTPEDLERLTVRGGK
jgi:molybdopterin-guanine dinucleotide biosynthesis protein A